VERDNKTLTAHCDTVNAHIRDFHSLNGRWPSCEELGAVIEAKAAPIADEAEESLLSQLQNFIDSKTDWAEATRKGFKTLSNNIKAYQQATKVTWLLSTLSNEDITNWQHWLLKTYDYNNATLGKRVRLLRQLLFDKQPANVNLKKVKPLHSQMLMPPVVLSQREIEAIRKFDFHFSPKLERVQDLMLAQIFTGLRFSDLIRLKKHHIQKRHLIIRMQKTNQTVKIPVFSHFEAITSKYTNDETGELELPTLSNQKFNEYIKELCEFIPELRREVTIEFKKRDKTDSKAFRKCDLITSHSSRRSFCSLCLDLGYSVKEVMQWSGHRTMAAFSRYVGLSDISETANIDFDSRYQEKLIK
jgi:integrase